MTITGSARVDATAVLGRGVTLGAHVRIGPYAEIGAGTRVGDGAWIGPGARLGDGVTIAPGLRVGVDAAVRDAAVVRDHVPALAVVAGSPARVVSYAHNSVARLPGTAGPDGNTAPSPYLRLLPEVVEDRGALVVLDRGPDLPFEPRRCLLIHGVPPGGHRGDHAHRSLHEVLVCVHGRCLVLLDDGRGRREVVPLTRPGLAALVPPRTWTAQYDHSADAVLMVLSSAAFDPDEHVEDYGEFRNLVGAA
ncbi:WxcM-like domain-containing protein [Polymorphospora lycopeni]|uniref:WxcM-like domain-containing protein n=1 Tax=Polymorphospora lycopeni TaxID=3140240 RepID=A0ABV5CQZ7_9ACTN